MCDFRTIHKIRILKTGQVIDVVNHPGLLNTATGRWETSCCDSDPNWESKPYTYPDPPPFGEGMYHIGCSGVGQHYWDGSGWLEEYSSYYPELIPADYEVVAHTDLDLQAIADTPR